MTITELPFEVLRKKFVSRAQINPQDNPLTARATQDNDQLICFSSLSCLIYIIVMTQRNATVNGSWIIHLTASLLSLMNFPLHTFTYRCINSLAFPHLISKLLTVHLSLISTCTIYLSASSCEFIWCSKFRKCFLKDSFLFRCKFSLLSLNFHFLIIFVINFTYLQFFKLFHVHFEGRFKFQ